MPHYNWQIIEEPDSSDKEESYEENNHNLESCEMCGNTELRKPYVVYHDKFYVTEKYAVHLSFKDANSKNITNPGILVLYLKKAKLYGLVKHKRPLLLDDLESKVLQALKGKIIKMKKSSTEKKVTSFFLEEEIDIKKTLLNFTYDLKYTDSNKFWLTKNEQKEKSSLVVGSSCVKTLQFSKEDVKEWRNLHAHYKTFALNAAERQNKKRYVMRTTKI